MNFSMIVRTNFDDDIIVHGATTEYFASNDGEVTLKFQSKEEMQEFLGAKQITIIAKTDEV